MGLCSQFDSAVHWYRRLAFGDGAGVPEEVHSRAADKQGWQFGAESWLQVLLSPAGDNHLPIGVYEVSLCCVFMTESRPSS
jgi:hypothetical protein